MTPEPQSDSFRNSLGIVSAQGKRSWIYPRKPSGSFYRMRTLLSLLLLVILFGTPWLHVNGHPFMLFNIVERKFILFGMGFGPHDFFLLVIGMISVIVFIILFTVVFGRLFCGWLCPQTVLMEMVFRKIDYWIEGDHRQQRRLDESAWNGTKIRKKLLKYAIYLTLSFLIANTLLAYVIGLDQLIAIVSDPPGLHLAGLTAILIFSVVFYWIFIWFREQACILVCPYGRLQGVLLDSNSIVIAYDHTRGEPRQRRRRNELRTVGDCIECNQCVEVCPTGIDIRNGTQLECVNCTACIDACDAVMTKIRKPKGLIRYASANGITSGVGFRWTPRIVGYSVVLLLLVSLLTGLVASRTEIDVTVLRTPGMFYQEQAEGKVSNVYDLKILNKTFAGVSLSLKLQKPAGEIIVIGGDLMVPSQGILEQKLLVVLKRDDLHALNTPVTIGVFQGERMVQEITTSFLGPGKQK